MDTPKPKTVDEYIAIALPETKEHLERMRLVIIETAPDAVEYIGYEMPAYKLYGRVLIYFAGFTKHVSLFPGPEAIEAFKDKLSDYKTSGGTIRFSLDKKIPTALIKQIVKFCMKRNLEKAKDKKVK